MKKIFLLSVYFTSIIFSQESPESILNLKTQLSLMNEQYQVSSIQHPETSSRKNAGLAILYSLLLPGMGELYAGDYSSGIYFTIADGILWSAFAGFNIYGNWQEENYRSFAQSNASVNLSGKDSEFFANVGSYNNVDDYNTIQELNRDFGNVYNTSTHYWKWETNEKRKEFRNMWSSSEQAFNNLRFAVGALLLNRLISVVNAVRLVTAYNKKLSEYDQLNISFGIQHSVTLPSAYTLNIRTQF